MLCHKFIPYPFGTPDVPTVPGPLDGASPPPGDVSAALLALNPANVHSTSRIGLEQYKPQDGELPAPRSAGIVPNSLLEPHFGAAPPWKPPTSGASRSLGISDRPQPPTDTMFAGNCTGLTEAPGAGPIPPCVAGSALPPPPLTREVHEGALFGNRAIPQVDESVPSKRSRFAPVETTYIYPPTVGESMMPPPPSHASSSRLAVYPFPMGYSLPPLLPGMYPQRFIILPGSRTSPSVNQLLEAVAVTDHFPCRFPFVDQPVVAAAEHGAGSIGVCLPHPPPVEVVRAPAVEPRRPRHKSAPHRHRDSSMPTFQPGKRKAGVLTAGSPVDDGFSEASTDSSNSSQSVSTPPAARPQARPQAVEQPRPFVCTYGGGCIAAFKTVTARAAHVRTHTGEKPYKCHFPGCGDRFSQKSSANRHERLRHGDWANAGMWKM